MVAKILFFFYNILYIVESPNGEGTIKGVIEGGFQCNPHYWADEGHQKDRSFVQTSQKTKKCTLGISP